MLKNKFLALALLLAVRVAVTVAALLPRQTDLEPGLFGGAVPDVFYDPTLLPDGRVHIVVYENGTYAGAATQIELNGDEFIFLDAANNTHTLDEILAADTELSGTSGEPGALEARQVGAIIRLVARGLIALGRVVRILGRRVARFLFCIPPNLLRVCGGQIAICLANRDPRSCLAALACGGVVVARCANLAFGPPPPPPPPPPPMLPPPGGPAGPGAPGGGVVVLNPIHTAMSAT